MRALCNKQLGNERAGLGMVHCTTHTYSGLQNCTSYEGDADAGQVIKEQGVFSRLPILR